MCRKRRGTSESPRQQCDGVSHARTFRSSATARASASMYMTWTATWRRTKWCGAERRQSMARPPRRGKNLVVRGDTYYFRKTIKGKPYMVSTDVRVGGSPEFALAEKRARQIENDINEGRFGFKKEEEKKESATVGVWCDRMMRSHVALLAPGTQSSYAFATLILRTTKAPFAVWED